MAVQIIFHQGDCRFVHLLPFPVHQFDAIIIEGIVTGGNHHAAVKTIRPGYIGHRGCCGHMQQIHIRARGSNSSADRVLQHVAGAAGILAYYNARPLIASIVPSQKASDFIGMLGSQLLIRLASETVRSKISSHIVTPSCILKFTPACRFVLSYSVPLKMSRGFRQSNRNGHGNHLKSY